jgi:ferrous iron transport protein A
MLEKLSNLVIGQKAKIVKINSQEGDKRIKQRLRDMGIIAGEEIYIRKAAPLGDPIEVIVKNYSLTLRKKEAELILIEKND